MKKKFLKTIKCYSPVLNTIQLILSLVSLYICIYNGSFITGLFSIVFAWQIGWMMSSNRFLLEKEKNYYYDNKKKYEEGQVIEVYKPVIFSLKLILSLLLLIFAIKTNLIIIGFLSLLFAWSVGWSIKLKVYKNSEI